MLGSVRLWVTAVIPLVYYRLNKCLLNSISIVLLLKYIFPVLFFYLSKILRQYFSFYLDKIFRQYFYLYLSKSTLTSTLVQIELLLLTFTEVKILSTLPNTDWDMGGFSGGVKGGVKSPLNFLNPLQKVFNPTRILLHPPGTLWFAISYPF